MDSSFLIFSTAVVTLAAFFWFFFIMGSAEVKGKSAFNLKTGSIQRDKVQDNYKQYHSFFQQPTQTLDSSNNLPFFVDTFYNLVTDMYEWGWGQSFHFSPSLPNKSHRDATRVHEEHVGDLVCARPGDRILDVGCGVGGPMRTIAARSGSNVIGITINEYQVSRARKHNAKAGLASSCEVVCGNFLEMPFRDSCFDGAYSIEATCHAPILQDVYAEIYRVLKPGSLYLSHEWVTTGLYRCDDPRDVESIKGIEIGNALPELRRQDMIADVARKVGFEVIEERDLALPPNGTWWERLKIGRVAYWRNHLVILILSLVGIAPKGVVEVHDMLCETARHLTRGGEKGIFTPMYMILCRKPLNE